MKIGQQDLLVLPSSMDRCRARTRARGAVYSVLTVLFITQSIFGLFQLFLSLKLQDTLCEKNAYKHTIVGRTVWPGSPFLRFRHVFSLQVYSQAVTHPSTDTSRSSSYSNALKCTNVLSHQFGSYPCHTLAQPCACSCCILSKYFFTFMKYELCLKRTLEQSLIAR